MATSAAAIDASLATSEIEAAWQSHKKNGLEFGKVVLHWKTEFSAQGSHHGSAFQEILKGLGIERHIADYWASKWECSIGKGIPCAVCSLTFPSKTQLKRHLQSKHPESISAVSVAKREAKPIARETEVEDEAESTGTNSFAAAQRANAESRAARKESANVDYQARLSLILPDGTDYQRVLGSVADAALAESVSPEINAATIEALEAAIQELTRRKAMFRSKEIRGAVAAAAISTEFKDDTASQKKVIKIVIDANKGRNEPLVTTEDITAAMKSGDPIKTLKETVKNKKLDEAIEEDAKAKKPAKKSTKNRKIKPFVKPKESISNLIDVLSLDGVQARFMELVPYETAKSLHRDLVKLYHPDREGGDETKMTELNLLWKNIENDQYERGVAYGANA